MATSGSWDFSLTAAQLITRSAKNISVLAPGETMSSADQADMLQILNIIAKEHQGTADGTGGLKVHTRQRVVLFLAKGQQEYFIGPAATDARATTQYGRTTISADEAASQTTLSITATTDTTTFPGTTVTMTASDIIGIQQTDGTMFWSTISSTGAGPTVVIATGLDSAAASGKYVYWFTSRAQRFPVIEGARLRTSSLTESPIEVYRDAMSYDQGVSDKYADGDPQAILVEPLRIATRVTLNSQPTDVTKQIVLSVLYPAEDYDAITNDIAFPQEWIGFLEWELALRSCPMFGAKWTPEMEKNYNNAKNVAFNLNPEVSDLYFQSGGV